MIEHYSHKIQNAIQKELFKANSSIKIAVAWFTNDLLFQPLLLKLGAGVSVELILNKDDINCSSDNEIDFDEFVNAGGILRWNDTKQLLHDKFCIIDDNVVIYGSYNWTNKAEYNEESIAISKNEANTTKFYLEKYTFLSAKYPKVHNKVTVANEKINHSTATRNVGEEARKTQSDNNNSLEVKEITPYHFPSTYGLHFYDDINSFQLYCNKTLYVIAKKDNHLCFVNPTSFQPINDVLFTRFAMMGDLCSGDIAFDRDSKSLWLEVNKKWGLYNTGSRRFIIPPIYDSYDMKNRYTYKYYVVCINQKYGLVAKTGQIMLDCKFDKITIIGSDEKCVVVKDGVYGLFANGRIDYDNKYKYYFSDGKYPVQINGKHGVYGYGARLILDFVYDNIEYHSNGASLFMPAGSTADDFHILTKNGKYGIHSCRTDETTDCIYNSIDEMYDDIEKGL